MITEFKYKDREEWLQLRKNYIGGSDAGAAIGLNPYSSPYRLWAEKTGKIPGFEGNIITRTGSYLEDFVAQLFTEETGKKVRRKNTMLVNDQYPFACADVDRVIVGEKALLEIKTTNSFPVMRKVKGGEYPEQWYAQMMHYLAVTGYERAYLAVLINCREFKWFVLERDEDEIAALMSAERDFWQYVTNDTPPPADGTQATTDTLQTIYTESYADEVQLFGREYMLQEYFKLKDQQKAIEERMTEITNIIKTDMQTSEKASCGNYGISWKSQARRSFQTKEFERDFPDIDLTPYYRNISSRVFRITERKGE